MEYKKESKYKLNKQKPLNKSQLNNKYLANKSVDAEVLNNKYDALFERVQKILKNANEDNRKFKDSNSSFTSLNVPNSNLDYKNTNRYDQQAFGQRKPLKLNTSDVVKNKQQSKIKKISTNEKVSKIINTPVTKPKIHNIQPNDLNIESEKENHSEYSFKFEENTLSSINLENISTFTENFKPPIFISSFEDEINKTFKKETFNDIAPTNYNFKDWKLLIKILKTKKEIMDYALAKGPLDFDKLDDLVEYLKKSPAKFDVEKIWLIFIWITEHIAYDHESYELKVSSNNDPEDVFWNLKCTCEGFAMLFKYICNKFGFECLRISGYSKGAFFDTSNELKRTDHSWNAVKLANRWELVDCTWGVGYTKENEFLENSIEFVKKFQPYYFLTPPQFFICDHYSEDYQLQKERITLEDFRTQPKFEVFFHMYELECLTHKKADIVSIKSYVHLKFKCPKTTTVFAKLKDSNDNKIDNAILLGRNPLTNNYEINVSMPKPQKKYSLILYAKYTKDTEKPFKEVCRFNLTYNNSGNNKQSCLTTKKLVKMLNPLNQDVFLFRPIFSELEKNVRYKFKIYHKNAFSVGLVDQNMNWVYLKKNSNEPNMWYAEHAFKSNGTVNLMVQMGLYENYKEVCSYYIL